MKKNDIFRKIIEEKFGSYQKTLYLCTRNSEINLKSNHEHP